MIFYLFLKIIYLMLYEELIMCMFFKPDFYLKLIVIP
jgi:hypothetical protein